MSILKSQSKKTFLSTEESENIFQLYNLCQFKEELKIEIEQCSSEIVNCTCSNVLEDNRNKLWLTQSQLPQFITINILGLLKITEHISYIGIDCWHDYPSNPKSIKIMVSQNLNTFIDWAILKCEQREGFQIFQINPISLIIFKYMKFLITESFGSNYIYLNQITLYSVNPFDQQSIEFSQQLSSLEKKINKMRNSNSINSSKLKLLKLLESNKKNINDASENSLKIHQQSIQKQNSTLKILKQPSAKKFKRNQEEKSKYQQFEKSLSEKSTQTPDSSPSKTDTLISLQKQFLNSFEQTISQELQSFLSKLINNNQQIYQNKTQILQKELVKKLQLRKAKIQQLRQIEQFNIKRIPKKSNYYYNTEQDVHELEQLLENLNSKINEIPVI